MNMQQASEMDAKTAIPENAQISARAAPGNTPEQVAGSDGPRYGRHWMIGAAINAFGAVVLLSDLASHTLRTL